MQNNVDITYVPEIINALPVLSKALNMQETFAGHRLYYRARIQLIFNHVNACINVFIF